MFITPQHWLIRKIILMTPQCLVIRKIILILGKFEQKIHTRMPFKTNLVLKENRRNGELTRFQHCFY